MLRSRLGKLISPNDKKSLSGPSLQITIITSRSQSYKENYVLKRKILVFNSLIACYCNKDNKCKAINLKWIMNILIFIRLVSFIGLIVSRRRLSQQFTTKNVTAWKFLTPLWVTRYWETLVKCLSTFNKFNRWADHLKEHCNICYSHHTNNILLQTWKYKYF